MVKIVISSDLYMILKKIAGMKKKEEEEEEIEEEEEEKRKEIEKAEKIRKELEPIIEELRALGLGPLVFGRGPYPQKKYLPQLEKILKIAEHMGLLKIEEDGSIKVLQKELMQTGDPARLYIAYRLIGHMPEGKDPEILEKIMDYASLGLRKDPMYFKGYDLDELERKIPTIIRIAKRTAEKNPAFKDLLELHEKFEFDRRVKEIVEEIKKKERELFPWWKLFLENLKKKERMHIDELKEHINHLEAAEEILGEAEKHLIEKGELDHLKLGVLVEDLARRGHDKRIAELFKRDVEEIHEKEGLKKALEKYTAGKDMVHYVKGFLSIAYADKKEKGETHFEKHELESLHAKLTDALAEMHKRYRKGWYKREVI